MKEDNDNEPAMNKLCLMCMKETSFIFPENQEIFVECRHIYGTIECPNFNKCDELLSYETNAYWCSECNTHPLQQQQWIDTVYQRLDTEGQARIKKSYEFSKEDWDRMRRLKYNFSAERMKRKKLVTPGDLIEIMTKYFNLHVNNTYYVKRDGKIYIIFYCALRVFVFFLILKSEKIICGLQKAQMSARIL